MPTLFADEVVVRSVFTLPQPMLTLRSQATIWFQLGVVGDALSPAGTARGM